jgi:hypothetical protein
VSLLATIFSKIFEKEHSKDIPGGGKTHNIVITGCWPDVPDAVLYQPLITTYIFELDLKKQVKQYEKGIFQ